MDPYYEAAKLEKYSMQRSGLDELLILGSWYIKIDKTCHVGIHIHKCGYYAEWEMSPPAGSCYAKWATGEPRLLGHIYPTLLRYLYLYLYLSNTPQIHRTAPSVTSVTTQPLWFFSTIPVHIHPLFFTYCSAHVTTVTMHFKISQLWTITTTASHIAEPWHLGHIHPLPLWSFTNFALHTGVISVTIHFKTLQL